MTILFLLLAATIGVNTAYNGINNHMGKTRLNGPPGRFLYLACVFAAGTVITASFAIPAGSVSFYTFAMGVGFGVVHASATVLLVHALSIGPMALVNLIVSCAMLLPTFSGMMIWNEPVAGPQWVGVALMVVALILCADVVGKKSAGTNRRWVTVSLCTAVVTSGLGLFQKIFQKSAHTGEVAGFLAISFSVSAIGAYLAYLAYKKRDAGIITGTATESIAHPVVRGPAWSFWAIATAAGLMLGGLNLLILHLVGSLPSVLFFPVHNGGVILCSAMVGLVLFREKLTRPQWFGFAFGVAAILLLGNIAELLR